MQANQHFVELLANNIYYRKKFIHWSFPTHFFWCDRLLHVKCVSVHYNSHIKTMSQSYRNQSPNKFSNFYMIGLLDIYGFSYPSFAKKILSLKSSSAPFFCTLHLYLLKWSNQRIFFLTYCLLIKAENLDIERYLRSYHLIRLFIVVNGSNNLV